uniref:NR LBD domain-containing protein n=1 Tax=Romanomermis culicivorax TaxID=13658 RepID=A0A915JU14_ROMCU
MSNTCYSPENNQATQQRYHTLNSMNTNVSTFPPQPTMIAASLPPSQQQQQTPATSNNNSVVQYTLMQEIKNIPKGNEFKTVMSMWQWVMIDNVRLPCVFRQGEKFLSAHMIQMRLLAKFPSTTPQEVTQRHTMISYKMLALEAWIFNTINALECKFEFGFQLFTPNDEIVRLTDVEKFYAAVKVHNLMQAMDAYSREAKVAMHLHIQLAEHIGTLKVFAENELKLLVDD